jgi:hypothetical protein
MDDRRLAAMEPCTLHQSLLSAECKASRTEGRDRDRCIAPNRAGGGNHLRLWAGLSEALFGEWRLPLRSMPQKESSSSPENSPPRTDQISWWSQFACHVVRRLSLFAFLTLCLVRAPRSSAAGALRIIRHELEVAVRVGWAEIGVFGLSRLPVARPNKPHPMCGFDEILTGNALSAGEHLQAGHLDRRPSAANANRQGCDRRWSRATPSHAL